MILHVTTDFSGQGGAQAMLARLLSKSREKAVVVALTEVSDRCRNMANNDRVEYVSLRAQSPLALPRAIWKIRQLIQKHKPDVVLCWMYHAMVVGLIADKLSSAHPPVVWTIRQALDDPDAFTRSTRIAVNLSKTLSRFTDGIIYNSTRALEQHEKYGFADTHSSVIPNGFILPKSAQDRSGPVRTLGVAARFHPQKDFGTFFRAFADARRKVPDLKARLAGDGVTSDNPEIREMLSTNDLPSDSVALCGDLSDMTDFYNSIDALVLSSRTEGFPNVIAEAMSFGRPVVTTDVGDSALIVGDNGYVVPMRDPDAMAEAMVQTANWPAETYQSKSREAQDRIARRYSLTAIADAYDCALAKAISRRGHPVVLKAE
ncbi:glycosyltransferase [Roseibium sp. RKSG952]|nr:glycosyltransferase [Roseibium sp. RKSG952]